MLNALWLISKSHKAKIIFGSVGIPHKKLEHYVSPYRYGAEPTAHCNPFTLGEV